MANIPSPYVYSVGVGASTTRKFTQTGCRGRQSLPDFHRVCEPDSASLRSRSRFSRADIKKSPTREGRGFFWHPQREFRLWRISFTLPLTSELDALCGEDANPIPLHFARGAGSPEQISKNPPPERVEDFLAPATGIEPVTNP